MATIVRDAKDPWWAPLAVNVLGGLVGGLVNDWQEREKNKKANAYYGALGETINALSNRGTQSANDGAQSGGLMTGVTGLLGANEPEGYNSNGWANTFHKTNNPLAQYDAETTGLLGTATAAGQTTAPTPAPVTPSQTTGLPTAADIYKAAMELAGTKRFAMLNPETVQKMVTPYMQANEAARLEQMRNALAQDYTNATDSAGRKNVAVSAFLRQLVDNAGFNSLVNANAAAPQNIDLGGSILPGTFDSWTGQTTYGEPLAKSLTPQQAADNAFRDKSFTEDVRRNNRDFVENNNRWWTSRGDSRIDADRNYGLQERQLNQNETMVKQVQVMPDGHVYGITGNGGTVQLSHIPGLTSQQSETLKYNAQQVSSLTRQLEAEESSRRVDVAKGLDVTERDKRINEIREKNLPVPIILLSANDTDSDVVKGLELGADDYVTKPFSLSVLRARVNTQLRKHEADPPGDVIRIGDYSFDFERMIFTVSSEEVSLSRIEQRLLKMLVLNRGITLSRDVLIDRLWTDGAEYVDENALSVAIKRLRDKLSAKDYIKTVYGLGYMWVKSDE